MFGDQNGDVGCNSYELWGKDLECIQQLGLTHYRLSLSWARLLPDGTTRHVNQKGIFYILVRLLPYLNPKEHNARLMVVVLLYLNTTTVLCIFVLQVCSTTTK